MNETIHRLLVAAGCKPKKAVSISSVEATLQKFGQSASKPLRDLFLTANGGTVRRLNSRFFSLKESISIWENSFSELEWRFYPFFSDEEHESDPVVLGMDGPLQGYVCQAKHGSDWRVLAPNLNSFIRFLKRLPDNKRFFVEEGSFVYPRTLSEGELYVAKGLVDLSYESKATCMERSTFAELALSMISDAELLQVLRLESHPDSNSSFLIRRRLEAISTAPAKKALAKICGK